VKYLPTAQALSPSIPIMGHPVTAKATAGDPRHSDDPAGSLGIASRVRAETERRRAIQMRQLYPLRLVVLVVTVVPALVHKPGAGLEGKGLGISLCLIVFGAGLMISPPPFRQRIGELAPVAVLLVAGAAAVALVALQPQATSEIPVSAVVLLTAIRFPRALAAAVIAPLTVGMAIAVSVNSAAGDVVGAVLLLVVLAVMGELVRQARQSQDRTEILLAELEAARHEQARSAAVEERSRIARELHDVLAHSLSALSIQLEGARKLAMSQCAASDLQAVIDRSASLAKEGLSEARNAVGALRDGDLLSVERLPELVEHYRRDLNLVVDFTSEGPRRPLAPEVSLTLYRVAGEALTNVLRHAPGAAAHVHLTWTAGQLRLSVSDEGASGPAAAAVDGGGFGLKGIAERVSRLEGSLKVGPDGDGWLVEVTVPA
jgi:signal transduction histidine kinase